MVITAGSGDWFGVLGAFGKGFAPHFELFSRRLRAERVAFLRTTQNAVAAPSFGVFFALHGRYAAIFISLGFLSVLRFGRYTSPGVLFSSAACGRQVL